jgi:nicotinate-nucleotide adenylyltransferase
MMRIGYFGGSFDPPHRGHLAVARTAAAAFALDTVLLVPTSNQPLKPEGPSAPYADRLAMVKLLCAESEDAHCVASDLEAPPPGNPPHYTVDTLEQLRSTLAFDDRLFVLAGADAFLQLPAWRSPHRLLTLADWIVVSRPGFDPARLNALLAALMDELALSAADRERIHLLVELDDPTSATTLRRQLAASVPPAEVAGLPPSILAYMRQHHLYGL